MRWVRAPVHGRHSPGVEASPVLPKGGRVCQEPLGRHRLAAPAIASAVASAVAAVEKENAALGGESGVPHDPRDFDPCSTARLAVLGAPSAGPIRVPAGTLSRLHPVRQRGRATNAARSRACADVIVT